MTKNQTHFPLTWAVHQVLDVVVFQALKERTNTLFCVDTGCKIVNRFVMRAIKTMRFQEAKQS